MPKNTLRRSYTGAQVITLMLVCFAAIGFIAHAQNPIDVPFEFQPQTAAKSAEVNENFQTLCDAISQRPAAADELHVATAGAEYSTVSEALAVIDPTLPAADRPFLIVVHPGVFEEPEMCRVPSFVHIVGAGPAVSIIQRDASSTDADSDAATTVLLETGATLTNVGVSNTATTDTAVAIRTVESDDSTILRNVAASVVGAGGSEHIALFLRDSDVRVFDSLLVASGATSLNAGVVGDDNFAAFSQPLFRNNQVQGLGITTGVGFNLTKTAAQIEDTRIEGENRGVESLTVGISTLRNCQVKTLGLNACLETTGAASILSGTTHFIGGNSVGLATSFKFAHCIKSNHNVIVNGFGSTVAP